MSGHHAIAVLRVPTVDVEMASLALWTAGASAVEERDDGDAYVALVADVETSAVERVLAESAGLGARTGGWVLSERIVHEEDYLDQWRDFAEEVCVQTGVYVRPTWVDHVGADSDLVLSIDPMRAWGHGAHPTTVLVAQQLLQLVESAMSVLDLGCGSGVLSLVAATRGAQVAACDIDPAARVATAHNAALNGLEEKIEVVDGDLGDVHGRFDLVAANIGAAAFVDVAPALVRLCTSNAVWIVSGVLVEQLDHLAEVLAPYGAIVSVTTSQGWACVAMTRCPENSPTVALP